MIPRRYQPPSGSFGRWYDSILVGMMCDLENIWKFIKSSGATKWWGTEQTTQLPSSSRELYLEALLERKFKRSWQHKVLAKQNPLSVSRPIHRQSTSVTDSVPKPSMRAAWSRPEEPPALHLHSGVCSWTDQAGTLVSMAVRPREWKCPRHIQAAEELEENVYEDSWRLAQWKQSFTVPRLPGHRLTDTWSHQASGSFTRRAGAKNACLWREVSKKPSTQKREWRLNEMMLAFLILTVYA